MELQRINCIIQNSFLEQADVEYCLQEMIIKSYKGEKVPSGNVKT